MWIYNVQLLEEFTLPRVPNHYNNSSPYWSERDCLVVVTHTPCILVQKWTKHYSLQVENSLVIFPQTAAYEIVTQKEKHKLCK